MRKTVIFLITALILCVGCKANEVEPQTTVTPIATATPTAVAEPEDSVTDVTETEEDVFGEPEGNDGNKTTVAPTQTAKVQTPVATETPTVTPRATAYPQITPSPTITSAPTDDGIIHLPEI